MSGSFVNAKELQKKLTKLSDGVVEKYIDKAVLSGLLPVQSAAKLNVPVGSGELRGSIRKRVELTSYGAKGIVYTNKVYAPYVELGTGPKGAENHSGINPKLNVTYTMQPWWIHESQIDVKMAEKFHWFSIDTPDGRFYQCTGQPAQPFMYPALKSTEKQATKNIGRFLAKKIREEVVKK